MSYPNLDYGAVVILGVLKTLQCRDGLRPDFRNLVLESNKHPIVDPTQEQKKLFHYTGKKKYAPSPQQRVSVDATWGDKI